MANKILKKIKVTILITWSLLILYYSIKLVEIPDIKAKGVSIPGMQHLIAYFVFAALLLMVLRDHGIRDIFIATILITFVYGSGMEIIQSLLPWRNFSLFDLFFNLLGGVSIIVIKPIYRQPK